MDYVTFVGRVLDAVVETTGSDYNARLVGVSSLEVLRRLDLGIDAASPEFWASDAHRAYNSAVEDLEDLYLVETGAHSLKVVDYGFAVQAQGIAALWPQFFANELSEEQDAFLRALVELSEQPRERYALLSHPSVQEVWTHLGWPWTNQEIARVVYFHRQLKGANLIRGGLAAGGHIFGLAPTYRGFVRTRESEPTVLHQKIDELLPEWETTTVEFKREIPLETRMQRAEFAKDLCALATTKASGGQRYLVIGFDAKSRRFVRSVDASLTQDRIEQILNAHCDPAPTVRLYTGPWQAGVVGLIVVAREVEKIPYRLKRATAADYFSGREVFVRHGSQVEPPSDAEFAALIVEAKHTLDGEA